MAIDLNRLTCYHTANGKVCLSCWLFQYRMESWREKNGRKTERKSAFLSSIMWEWNIFFFALSLRWYKVILIPMQIAIDIHIALTKKNQHNHHHHQLFQVPLVIFFFFFLCSPLSFTLREVVHLFSEPGSKQFVESIAMTKPSIEKENIYWVYVAVKNIEFVSVLRRISLIFEHLSTLVNGTRHFK